MCYLRRELCTNCRRSISDVIVFCSEFRRIYNTNIVSDSIIQTIPYSVGNLNSIMDKMSHSIPTVERTSSLCENCYPLMGTQSMNLKYEDYRRAKDMWMQPRRK